MKNRSHLRTEHKLESLISRESSFLFNNLLLLVACFTVLWGTLFPKLSELVNGTKITVGPPFFNRVNIPVALLLLLLTGLGPLLAWRKTSFESLKRNFRWPALGRSGDRCVADRSGHEALAQYVLRLLADDHHAFGAGGTDRDLRIHPRRTSYQPPHWPESAWLRLSISRTGTRAATADTSFTSA